MFKFNWGFRNINATAVAVTTPVVMRPYLLQVAKINLCTISPKLPNKSGLPLCTKAATKTCSVKKVFLKILQNSQKNTFFTEHLRKTASDS